MTRIRSAWILALLAGVLGSLAVPAEAEVRLRYVSRYVTQTGYHDHLMGVTPVGDHHALVCSNLDIVVVDLDALTEGGDRRRTSIASKASTSTRR